MRSRTRSRPITIATLGHQQTSKGYHLMPEIVREVLATERDVRFLIHNSDPEQQHTSDVSPLKHAKLRLEEMARNDPRIMLEHLAVEGNEWSRLVDRCDLMICPYDPQRYAIQHSGLASAAVANAIPLVAPAGTTLARWVEDFGNAGATFAAYDATSIAETIRQVVRSFDVYADRAYLAAQNWAAANGPEDFIKGLLKLRTRRSAFAEGAKPVSAMIAAALKLKGDEALRQGRFERACTMYQASAAESPDLLEVYSNLGVALRELGKLPEAEAAMRRALALDPTRAKGLSNLGLVLSAMGRADEAISSQRRAVAIEPQNAWLRCNLAITLLQAGRASEAVAELNTAVTQLPDEAMVWFNLGEANAAAGSRSGALVAYLRVSVLRPDYPGIQEKIDSVREIPE